MWQIREGIIVTLEDSNGRIGQGEIAPLPWFGTETLAEAIDFCQSLGETIAPKTILQICDRLWASQFALESAWRELAQPATKNPEPKSDENLDFCYLLPAGEEALTSWQSIYQAQENSTFKWKIGVYPLATEIAILQQLAAGLPNHVKLRLDANGGLNFEQAQALLSACDLLKVEFIEQPLPPENLAQMIHLAQAYNTPLALDESIAGLKQLKTAHRQGWRGIFVIKAAIMGYPTQLLDFCQSQRLDVVFSSVFETKVGRNAVLKLAQQLNHPRALGFGLDYFC